MTRNYKEQNYVRKLVFHDVYQVSSNVRINKTKVNWKFFIVDFHKYMRYLLCKQCFFLFVVRFSLYVIITLKNTAHGDESGKFIY